MQLRHYLLFALALSIAMSISIAPRSLLSNKHQQDPYTMKVVEIATTQTMKKLLDDPSAAAKIPTKFIQGGIDGLIGAFTGAWNLKDRARSLQLTFVNLMRKKKVYFEDAYFDSGTWYQTWKPEFPPMSVNQGTVANRQGSWFTGVTGGFRLSIDGDNMKIYLGFNQPYIGGYKFYAELLNQNKPAKYGYDQSSNNNPKTMFASGSSGRYKLQAIQTPSTIAQMAFVYQISDA